MKSISTILLSTLFVFFYLNTKAQDWQWIERSGSTYQIQESQDEKPLDITTDRFGNIYLIHSVYPNNAPTVGDHVMETFSSPASNYSLVSFNCNGEYRWSKVIGSAAGATSNSIATDDDGNVYGVSRIYSQSWSPGQFGTEHFMTASERNFYIYKYDSLGVFQWVHSPVPDTTSFFYGYSNSYPVDLHVKGNGELTVFSLLPAGENEDGEISLTNPTFAAVKYNEDGIYLSHTILPIQISGTNSLEFTIWFNQSTDGHIIMSGLPMYPSVDNLEIDGQEIETAFVASFNPDGTLQWLEQFVWGDPSWSNAGFYGRAVLDEDDNIYLSGSASHGDQIAGYTFENPLQPNITSIPILLKFSPTGSLLWAQHGDVNAGTVGLCVAQSGNTVAAAGRYPGILRWQNASTELHHSENQGYDPFLAIFDKETGAFIMQDSLTGSTNSYEEIDVLAAMPGGNYAFAGYFPADLITPGGTINPAGTGDTFFGKFGVEQCFIDDITDGISDLTSITPIHIFPNPCNDYFNIETNEVVESVKIFDMCGSLVVSQKMNTRTVDVSGLCSGLYVVEVSLTRGSQHQISLFITGH